MMLSSSSSLLRQTQHSDAGWDEEVEEEAAAAAVGVQTVSPARDIVYGWYIGVVVVMECAK